MTIAVTGGSGHIGGNLVRALLDRGEAVRVLVRKDSRAIKGLAVEQVAGDVLDRDSLGTLVIGAEVVYHLAAKIVLVPDPNGSAQRVNVDGTRNVVDACLKTGVRRLVHFSSIHAFAEEPRGQVVDETRPLASGPHLYPYDRSKAEGERVVQEAVRQGLDAVIVNPTAVIGPFDFKPSAVGGVFLDLYHRRMPALIQGGFNWVDVRDVCAGAIAAEQLGRTGEKYLLAGHHLPFPGLATLVEEATGIPRPRVTVPLWAAYLGLPFAALASFVSGKDPKFTRASLHALCNHQLISHEKATRELDYHPRPTADAVRDTFDWFRRAGCLRDGT
jgi:dihydroflavonol-4-reductase